MPKVGKMRFPYTRQGMEDAQKYQNALSPEQEQMKRALEQSIAQQKKAILDGIDRIRQQNLTREIMERAAAVGALRGGASTGVGTKESPIEGPPIEIRGKRLPWQRGRAIEGVGSYKKGGKVKKKY